MNTTSTADAGCFSNLKLRPAQCSTTRKKIGRLHVGGKRSLTPGLLGMTALVALFFAPQQSPSQASFPPGRHAGSAQRREKKVDRQRLEVIEELSESLANDVLDLSLAVRERDLSRTAEFFPAAFSATAFPHLPLSAVQQVKWISQHGWTAEAADAGAIVAGSPGPADPVRKTTRENFLQAWSRFLDHFAEMEDVRFKIKSAQFDDDAKIVSGAKVPTATVGSRGQARIAFYVIGRTTDGQREWAQGVLEARLRRAENARWQFETFTLTSLQSMVATAELFSEVSLPAGVSATLQAFGSPANTGYVWHGAAAADFNNDGWLDLFVTGPDRNFLYVNDGQGRFRDATADAGLLLVDSGVAPVAFDYDNDGDQDVFISAVGPQVLLESRLVPEGKLTFRDVSVQAGVAVQALGFSAAAGDVNGDGRPDIYVACYNHYGRVVPDSWFRATNGTPNLLFVNQGKGQFREEAAKWGVDDRRWSYAAAFADVNGDGRQDLYVANDFGENGMFVNQGDRFVDEAQARGVLDPGNGMGVSFGDYNNDGLLDLHVTNMSSTAGNRIISRLFPAATPKDNVFKKLAAGNNLFQNTGRGIFRDVTAEAGGFSGGWAWGGGFFDFDNDGWEDLFTPNGFVSGKSMKDT